jgi:glycerophosphoryl diester phosphodiesterase
MRPLVSRFFFLVIFFVCILSWYSNAQENSNTLKIAGHRGGYYFEYPESSLELFGFIARQFHSDTITVELDLRRSLDGTIYIMHDETIDRTTNGHGSIDQQKDSYLSGLYLKKQNGQLTTERIPTFEQVLTFIKPTNINLMLDIKTDVFQEAIDLVKKNGLEGRMIVLTFNIDLTKKMALLSDKVMLSSLVETQSDWLLLSDVAIPQNRKIAYINSKAPRSLLQELKRNRINLMTDLSEALRNSGKPLANKDYQAFVKENLLDILITDFPIEARKALSDQLAR